MNIDLTAVKPYGDTFNDGQIQVSFTLPLPASPEAREAARRVGGLMGLDEVSAVHMKKLGEGFSFHILYGKLKGAVDVSNIKVAKVETDTMTYYEINDLIKSRLGRKLKVIGACTGFDAHTVGLDAIMNMKGFAGEYGLERYPEIETWNLGSQVPNEELIRKAVETDADAILVSQVVTQKDVHVKNLTNLVELLEAENLRSRFLVIVGGPRISHELALELGLDAGFGPGSLPPDVASYIAQTLVNRKGKD